jgi:hypothetical protein
LPLEIRDITLNITLEDILRKKYIWTTLEIPQVWKLIIKTILMNIITQILIGHKAMHLLIIRRSLIIRIS